MSASQDRRFTDPVSPSGLVGSPPTPVLSATSDLTVAGEAPVATDHPRTFLKQLLPEGLFGRSMLIIVTPLIFVQIVTTYVFFERHWSTLSRRLTDGLVGDVQVLSDLSERFPDRRAYYYSTTAAAMQLEAWFESGTTLPVDVAEYGNSFLGNMLGPTMARRLRRPFRLTISVRERDTFINVQLSDGVLHIMAPRERLFNSAMYIFLFWMVGTSLVLFVIALMFMRIQVRAVRRLAVAADSLGKGRDVPNFRPEGAAEVRQAAAAFIRMRERIRRQVSQRTAMLAGVSHDLRTPLTRMKLSLAMLGPGPDVDGLKADVAEMEQMVEGYLAFARGEGEETSRPTDMARLLTDLVEDMGRGMGHGGTANGDTAHGDGEDGARERASGPSFDIALGPLPVIPIRGQAIRRCVANLLSNAARHAAGRVSLRGHVDEDAIEILVDDDGPGIPNAQSTEVFKPFYRLDPSRNVTTGGVGLGLTIARDVVRNHGGDISLESAPLGGLRVRVRLPL